MVTIIHLSAASCPLVGPPTVVDRKVMGGVKSLSGVKSRCCKIIGGEKSRWGKVVDGVKSRWGKIGWDILGGTLVNREFEVDQI